MKQCVVGVDIGGTNTVFGVVDARGEIIKQGSIPTGKHATVDEYIAVLAPELNKLIESVGGREVVRGIGIGAPNANFYKGTIEDSVNIPWAKGKVVPFAQLISEETGLPASLTNDANAAAIGEMTYGVAKGMKNFIMITLGTGVGSGVVVNGQLVYGHDGFAGELGHVIIDRQNGRLCGCGRRGCLEAYASARGMALTAREIVEAGREDTLLSSCNLETLTSKDVYDMAKKGDKAAQGVFDYTGRILGEAFADFIAFSSPEAIVLFGGPTKAGDLIMNPIREAMEESVLGIFKGKTQVLLSQLPESDAAVLGASALAWDL
ncbi:ROK family protein [Bacteroidales bacterium OttesenSCG-928-L03]|nr:ROK family protein [Bacteroidales bacterium OttesenSCG-928-L03]